MPDSPSATPTERIDPSTEGFSFAGASSSISGDNSVTGSIDDIKQSPTYRGLKAVVIILGVLLAIGFGLLVVGLVSRFSGHRKEEAAAPFVFTLAPGAKVVATELDANRLVLHVRSPSGDEIDIIDTETGRLVGQVKPAPK